MTSRRSDKLGNVCSDPVEYALLDVRGSETGESDSLEDTEGAVYGLEKARVEGSCITRGPECGAGGEGVMDVSESETALIVVNSGEASCSVCNDNLAVSSLTVRACECS